MPKFGLQVGLSRGWSLCAVAMVMGRRWERRKDESGETAQRTYDISGQINVGQWSHVMNVKSIQGVAIGAGGVVGWWQTIPRILVSDRR